MSGNSKNMSEYISDLITIAGQEKASFDSVVNWTLMLNLAGFGFVFLKCMDKQNKFGLLRWVVAILIFVTFAFGYRAWRSYKNYYKYCNARRKRLENKEFEFEEDDIRGKPKKEPFFSSFLLTTEFLYIFLIQLILYLHLSHVDFCLSYGDGYFPLIVAVMVCLFYRLINCVNDRNNSLSK